jgi:hypothetical protein
MQQEDKEDLKARCGGNWKIVLRFLVQGEQCNRQGKPQADAGPGHSVVVTSSGKVYTFGNNSSGQLGTGSYEPERRPCMLRCERFQAESKLSLPTIASYGRFRSHYLEMIWIWWAFIFFCNYMNASLLVWIRKHNQGYRLITASSSDVLWMWIDGCFCDMCMDALCSCPWMERRA